MLGLSRLGLVGRMVVIVLIAVFGVIAIAAGLDFAVRERGTRGKIALPARVASMVALLNEIPQSARETALAALASEDLSVSIGAEFPDAGSVSGTGREEARLAGAEWLIAQYLKDPANARVAVTKPVEGRDGPIAQWIKLRAPTSTSPLIIHVGLDDGAVAEFRTTGSASRRLFGIPAGFWIGALGALLAFLAVRAVIREARPLRDLQTAVRAFGEDTKPRTVEARGAPDLRGLITTTNEMQARIAALVTGRTALLGAISHDMRTYLTRLRLRVESLPDERACDRATRDIDAMSELLVDAVSLAAATHSDDGDAEPIDVGAVVQDAVAARGLEAGVSSVDVGAGRAFARIGELALRRLTENLLDNALRHGTRVKVRVAPQGDAVVLQVEDDGPGIPEDLRDAVFEPFTRLDAARTIDRQGSGLGLAICRQIVEAAGGSIAIADAAIGGARVEVRLPLSPQKTRREKQHA